MEGFEGPLSTRTFGGPGCRVGVKVLWQWKMPESHRHALTQLSLDPRQDFSREPATERALEIGEHKHRWPGAAPDQQVAVLSNRVPPSDFAGEGRHRGISRPRRHEEAKDGQHREDHRTPRQDAPAHARTREGLTETRRRSIRVAGNSTQHPTADCTPGSGSNDPEFPPEGHTGSHPRTLRGYPHRYSCPQGHTPR